ncbi:VWA domain-containing protein [Myxococcus sp. CA051A]|uniref:vWA domain-containing protein n=1 Tax=unclassified Myxococcus TaxID=2648731 RepID=UPI00157A526C|nr:MULTISPECIES: vWA domain-containing protein [unclassified Myxococcus]NTX15689.1 VWA domain-containing protein [Myxococcus sp. CA056]NTX53211.1 VWA domain-containing protein [Myxococcus sp. CA039A]NTX65442.1 VWA domain-containing protein [Myxococcus sp. CA051A]
MGHEKPVEPFSDLHVEEGKVRAVLLHDPTVEGLDVAIYMDASGSMQEEYKYERPNRSFLEWLRGAPLKDPANQVEPQVQWMLEYLATKDRNGMLRVAYWASGASGKDVEVVGELKGVDVKQYRFPGAKKLGSHTFLAPALKDYVRYLKEQVPQGARRGCAVIVTDGQLHDADEVEAFSAKVAKDIAAGRLPRLNFVLVGVGDAIDEEQLEKIAHMEYPGVGHLWCHRIAKEINQVAELVAVLVDENMTVAAGGTIYDDKGKVLKTYEGRLPAVLEFDVPEGAESFTLEVNGQRFTQPLPDEDHHEEDEDHH